MTMLFWQTEGKEIPVLRHKKRQRPSRCLESVDKPHCRGRRPRRPFYRRFEFAGIRYISVFSARASKMPFLLISKSSCQLAIHRFLRLVKQFPDSGIYQQDTEELLQLFGVYVFGDRGEYGCCDATRDRREDDLTIGDRSFF